MATMLREELREAERLLLTGVQNSRDRVALCERIVRLEAAATRPMTGTELRRALVARGISPEQVARRARCSPAAVKLAFEVRNPPAQVVDAAEALLHERRMMEARAWAATLELSRRGGDRDQEARDTAIARLRKLQEEAQAAGDVIAETACIELIPVR